MGVISFTTTCQLIYRIKVFSVEVLQSYQHTNFSSAFVESRALIVLAALGGALLVHANLIAQTITDGSASG
jgi:hypothetical protein